MVITDTYATGISVSQEFRISALSHPIEAKGVLKIEADLTPYGRGDRDGPGVVGWAPRTLNVTLPDKLSELAGGVKIVTCRYLGGGQIERIQTARSVRAMERMERAGSAFLEVIQDKERRDEEAQTLSVTTLAVMAETAIDKLLIEYPPDLVCARAVRSIDDAMIQSDEIQSWVDDTHPDALKHVAVEVLRESGLIPETETESGEDSGGSSAS